MWSQLIEQCILSFLFGFTLPLSASHAADEYVIVESAVDVSVVLESLSGTSLVAVLCDGDRGVYAVVESVVEVLVVDVSVVFVSQRSLLGCLLVVVSCDGDRDC